MKFDRVLNFVIPVVLLLAASFALQYYSTFAQIDQPERLKITTNAGSPNDWTYAPSLSGSGDLVTFVSEATNIVKSDSNNTADVFLHSIKTGETQLISRSSDAVQANARSWAPRISADGRYIVFVSLANNLISRFTPEDTNALADVYIHDRQNKTTELISVGSSGESATGWSDQPVISGNGQFIVFVSTAQDLTDDLVSSNASLFIHDRADSSTKLLRFYSDKLDYNYDVSSPVISIDGRYIALIARSESDSEILLHDRITSQTQYLSKPYLSDQISADFGDLTISGDGSHLFVVHHAGISVYERKSQSWTTIPKPLNEASTNNKGAKISTSSRANVILISHAGLTSLVQLNSLNNLNNSSNKPISTHKSSWPAISPDGTKILIVKEMSGYSELLLQQLPPSSEDTLVTGWIGDGLGHPIIGAKVSALGKTVRTDREGNYSLKVPSNIYLRITPEKKGFTFSPSTFLIPSNQNNIHYAGASFTAKPGEIVVEANKDIGMPYSLGRGCPSPFEPCGGSFHGFYSGDCTDLVIDAYLHGVDLNIQLALELDFQRNARHYYRWRNARNSHDMWRFFSYSGLMLSPDEAYQIGDIVFFDWESDSTIDHVAIISEITSWNYPVKMIDATGYIDDNPGGLATELSWMPYHTTSTPGHSRWLGSLNQTANDLHRNTPILVIALDSPSVKMRVLDLANRSVSVYLKEIASAQYLSTGIGEVVSIDDPYANSSWYFLEISSPEASPYQIGIQTIQESEITHSRYLQGELSAGSIRLIPIQLVETGGRTTFTIPSS